MVRAVGVGELLVPRVPSLAGAVSGGEDLCNDMSGERSSVWGGPCLRCVEAYMELRSGHLVGARSGPVLVFQDQYHAGPNNFHLSVCNFRVFVARLSRVHADHSAQHAQYWSARRCARHRVCVLASLSKEGGSVFSHHTGKTPDLSGFWNDISGCHSKVIPGECNPKGMEFLQIRMHSRAFLV